MKFVHPGAARAQVLERSDTVLTHTQRRIQTLFLVGETSVTVGGLQQASQSHGLAGAHVAVPGKEIHYSCLKN